jgi:hypothetical protein
MSRAVLILAVGLLFAVLMPASLKAQFVVQTNNGTITIVKYTGQGGAVTIPARINNLPVTAIGNAAFYSCARLTSVTMGEGVKTIGIRAFQICHRLTSVTIPESVVSIGDYAFYFCTSLTNISIPNSVTSIGDYAFSGCMSLTGIAIPNSVVKIGDYALYACSGLTNVTVGVRVASIGKYAFAGCHSLSKVYFAGNAPRDNHESLLDDSPATIYRLPESTGWGSMKGNRSVSL